MSYLGDFLDLLKAMWLTALWLYFADGKERRLLEVHFKADDFQDVIPSSPRFFSLEETLRGCSSTGFSLESGEMSLEEMRLTTLDFYDSGTALLSNYHLVETILAQKLQVAAVCPQA